MSARCHKMGTQICWRAHIFQNGYADFSVGLGEYNKFILAIFFVFQQVKCCIFLLCIKWRGAGALFSVIEISGTRNLVKDLYVSRLPDHWLQLALCNSNSVEKCSFNSEWWEINLTCVICFDLCTFSCNAFHFFLELVAAIFLVLTL